MNRPAPDPGPPDAKSDTLGGVIMLAAAALALVWANSPWAASYGEALSFSVGPAMLGMSKSLGLWISDGLGVATAFPYHYARSPGGVEVSTSIRFWWFWARRNSWRA